MDNKVDEVNIGAEHLVPHSSVNGRLSKGDSDVTHTPRITSRFADGHMLQSTYLFLQHPNKGIFTVIMSHIHGCKQFPAHQKPL